MANKTEIGIVTAQAPTGQGVAIEGLAELKKSFTELSDSMQRGILRTALRQAARPVVRAARALVPVDTGLTKKAIGTKVWLRKDSVATVMIGVRRGKEGKRHFLTHLLELGTRNMRARPFLRPALDSQKNAAVEALAAALKSRIDKVTARVRQRG